MPILLMLVILFLLWQKTVSRLKEVKQCPAGEQFFRWAEAVAVWLFAVPVMFFALTMIFYPQFWPPFFIEHHRQRKRVFERVKSGGGWETLRNDCIDMATTNQETGISWPHSPTNFFLPHSLTELKASRIEYTPGRFLKLAGGEQVEVMRIKIFGIYSTGGHSTPYYGLEVVWGPGTNNYHPQPSHAATGYSHITYDQVFPNIYEIY